MWHTYKVWQVGALEQRTAGVRYQQLTSFITQALFSGFTGSLPSVMYSAKTIAVDNLDRYFNVSKYSVFHYRWSVSNYILRWQYPWKSTYKLGPWCWCIRAHLLHQRSPTSCRRNAGLWECRCSHNTGIGWQSSCWQLKKKKQVIAQLVESDTVEATMNLTSNYWSGTQFNIEMLHHMKITGRLTCRR